MLLIKTSLFLTTQNVIYKFTSDKIFIEFVPGLHSLDEPDNLDPSSICSPLLFEPSDLQEDQNL